MCALSLLIAIPFHHTHIQSIIVKVFFLLSHRRFSTFHRLNDKWNVDWSGLRGCGWDAVLIINKSTVATAATVATAPAANPYSM